MDEVTGVPLGDRVAQPGRRTGARFARHRRGWAATTGNVYALDAGTGQQRWAQPLGARGAAVADGVVYAGATGGIFDAFDAATGAVRWSFSTTDGQPLYNGAVGDGAIYISSNSCRGALEVRGPERERAGDRRWPDLRWDESRQVVAIGASRPAASGSS